MVHLVNSLLNRYDYWYGTLITQRIIIMKNKRALLGPSTIVVLELARITNNDLLIIISIIYSIFAMYKMIRQK